MSILRLTVFLSVAFVPFLLPGKGFSQLNAEAEQRAVQLTTPPTAIAQATTGDQSVSTSPSSSTTPSSSTNVQTPGTNLQTPGTNLQTPGANLQTPGTNLQTPGANLQTPGANLQTPGVGGQSPGVGGQSPGVGGQSSGVGSQTTGVTSQPTGVGGQTPGVGGQSSGVGGQTSGVGGQTPGVGGQSLGVGGQTPGVGGQTSGTTNAGQPSSPQTSSDGQVIGPSLPLSTKVPGAEQTFVNGRSTGTRQVAPPLSQPASSGATGTQVGPNTTLYPPQFIQGTGTVAPTPQTSTNTSGNGVAPLQRQSTPSTGTTSPATPGASQASPALPSAGQGTLDAALQQATCAQNWQQAIRLVNTAIAATPASQTSYRSQLVSYRSRLQTLQAKGVKAPNWSQQCRGGVANVPGQ